MSDRARTAQGPAGQPVHLRAGTPRELGLERRSHVGLVSPQSSGRHARRIDDTRRDELLGRIQEVILKEGFANLTVDELAARLQCSKSTLYAISTSREVLVATAIKRFLSEVTDDVEGRITEEFDPTERIAAYLTAVGTEMQRMSQSCFEDVGAHDSTREIYIAHSAALRQRIGEFINEGIESGDFRPVHGKFVADAVSLLIDGIQWGRLLEGTDLSPVDAYRELTELVLASLKK